jgi:tellurite resistance protein TehA-like permease
MDSLSVLYGVPVWGFAVLWIALAAGMTARAARRHLPFALTWWSFTFPVGTFVTGTTALANHTGLPAFRWAAVIAFAGLVAAWLTVGARTMLGVVRGDLLRPPAAVTPVAVKGEPAA